MKNSFVICVVPDTNFPSMQMKRRMSRFQLKRANVSNRSWRNALVRLNSAVRNLSPCRRMGHENGVALEGYDPVAYFTDGKPVKGSPEFTASYKGATYQIASAEQNSCSRNRPQNTNRNLAVSVGMLRPLTNWRSSRSNISRSCTID